MHSLLIESLCQRYKPRPRTIVPRPGYCDNGNVWGGPGNSGNSGPASTSHLLALTMVSVSGLDSHPTIRSLNSHIRSHNITHTYWRLEQSHNAVMRRAMV